MKKILFCINSLAGGGAENVLINLVNNLDTKEFDITVFSLFDYGVNKTRLKQNVKYKYFFKKIFRGNIYILKLFSPKFLYKKIIGEENYDVVISYLEGSCTRIISGCINKNTKLLNWVHTEIKEISEFSKCYRNIKEMQNCYSNYLETVFVSKTAESAFRNITKFNIKTRVIHNVILTDEILEKGNEAISASEKEMFTDDYTNIITLGRLIPIKGYLRLLNICKNLQNSDLQFKLHILGDGEQKEILEKFVKENEIKNIFFHGYKMNPYKYIKESDLFVCSSYAEGYSTAVSEAIVLGVPVITTNCSGMDEILDNGKYGIIVHNSDDDLEEGLKKVLLDKNVILEYQKLAEKRGNFFNTESNILAIENYFKMI